MSLRLRRRDLRTHLYIATVINFLATYVYIFLIFFLIFLLDFIIVTINLIQLLAAILIRINYLSIYLSVYLSIYLSISCTPINPKKYSCYGLKKIHAKKKNFLRLENSPPPP